MRPVTHLGLATPEVEEVLRADYNLQREYATHLVDILLYGSYWYPASVQTLVRHYVKETARVCEDALAAGKDTLDTYTRAHLDETTERLKRALEASYTID